MTKQDFEAIAALMRRLHREHDNPYQGEGGAEIATLFIGVTEALADYFAKQNPRFDRDRFLAACEPDDEGADVPTCRHCGAEWLPGHECS